MKTADLTYVEELFIPVLDEEFDDIAVGAEHILAMPLDNQQS